jgi:hypothetical protein
MPRNKLRRYDTLIQRPEKIHLDPPVGEMDHVRGVEDTPVTVLEYGNYECSYCGRAYPLVQLRVYYSGVCPFVPAGSAPNTTIICARRTGAPRVRTLAPATLVPQKGLDQDGKTLPQVEV